MPTVLEVAKILNEAFPAEDALSYDNVGFLVGRKEKPVKKILVALDVTREVIEEGKALGVDLILSHHPVIFRERKKITDESYTGVILLDLIESGIASIALHTNYDRGAAGNNEQLALRLGAKEYEIIEEGFATVFETEATPFEVFASRVKSILGDSVIRTIGGGVVRKVIASCGAGIGEEMILRAKEEDAVIVTADVKHNYAVMARDLGVRLVEATHHASEWGFVEDIMKYSEGKLQDVELIPSRRNINPYDAS